MNIPMIHKVRGVSWKSTFNEFNAVDTWRFELFQLFLQVYLKHIVCIYFLVRHHFRKKGANCWVVNFLTPAKFDVEIKPLPYPPYENGISEAVFPKNPFPAVLSANLAATSTDKSSPHNPCSSLQRQFGGVVTGIKFQLQGRLGRTK